MTLNHKLTKKILIFIFSISITLLITFTIDVISEEPDWAWFDIDFNSTKVANYATLIGGLLSFLAILFVIYGIAEQREQIEDEKEEAKNQVESDYINRLELLKHLLLRISDDIKVQGERMKSFYIIELQHPTQSNTIHFSASKSFKRILEMDYLLNYKSIQYFF